jgi:UDP-N-acetylglucosamine acyltransferase
MVMIHPTAIVAPKAQISQSVKVGPYCIVGPNVTLHDDVELISHVCIEGKTTIGARTVIFPFASIGHVPQDKKYEGEESKLIVGEDNRIREYVTMQPGTSGDNMLTKIGDRGLFMASTHVAHDCVVGDDVVMANNATLAGHVEVGDFVIIGGLAGIHQRVRIGSHAIIGGLSPVDGDVIPYGAVRGERAFLNGLNIIGLKRRGFSREAIDELRSAYRALFSGEGTVGERIEATKSAYKSSEIVMEIVAFMGAESKCGLCLPNE